MGVAGAPSHTKTATRIVTTTTAQMTTATQVKTTTITHTETVAARSTDCPGRVNNGGAGIGSIRVQGATCDKAFAVLAAHDHLGWTCRNLPGGRNGFPGVCEHGNTQAVAYVAGD